MYARVNVTAVDNLYKSHQTNILGDNISDNLMVPLPNIDSLITTIENSSSPTSCVQWD